MSSTTAPTTTPAPETGTVPPRPVPHAASKAAESPIWTPIDGNPAYHGSVWWRVGWACDSRLRDERSALNGWDRATGRDRRDGHGATPAGPAEDAAGQAGAAGGDDASGAQRQPDGCGGVPAAPGRAAGQPLPVDQAVSGQRACDQRRGDGALWAGGSGAAVGAGSDRGPAHRPDQGERAPSGRDGGGAPGRPRSAVGLAGEGDPGRDRLCRAARGA